MLLKCNKYLKNKNKNMKTNINKKNLTIDLKEIMCNEYIESKKTYLQKFIDKYIKKVALIEFIIILLLFIPKITNWYDTSENLSIQDKIRLERLEVCQNAYKNSWINEQFLYWQVPAVRCATYMSLIYAYESNFGKSRKCIEDKNCHWIKWNWYDTPRGFLRFETYREWREYFAKKYFKWHYKKNVSKFVYSWSITDRNTYINFVSSKYWNVYKELEYLYMTWWNR